ncbi:PEP-CTERM sorting domain-containing protein [Nostoc sp. UIC 10630]|uniref:PEP-CTERM sorting domain-containing protein n=1 Tax=Nostoc sp. UIC 10630 TaxID=2100146 RepID=UPI0013D38D41|nr:PEP-CTERM sorting domain-containing protein [Nostoc sp. UIC 10630]
MKSKFLHLSASVVLATGISGAFVAAPAQAVVCSTSNISLGGVNATACAGAFSGNDTGAGNPLETLLDGGLFASSVGNADWTLLAKSDQANSLFTAANGTNIGNWSLSQPLTSNTFVVSLKSSTNYSAYLFKDYDWSHGLAGVFNTIGVDLNGSGNAGKALSHASLFVSNISNNPAPQAVPEPATLLGLGLAASGMVISRRRKSLK